MMTALADARQLFADQHVYNPLTAELRLQDHNPCGLRDHLADDSRVCSSRMAAHCCK